LEGNISGYKKAPKFWWAGLKKEIGFG